MVLKKIYKNNMVNDRWYEGCIIDFETIGKFNDNEKDRYKDIKPFIFGIYNLQDGSITQYYVRENYINEDHLKHIIKILEEPFYAFSIQFESSIIKNMTGLEFNFRELQKPFSITKNYHENKQYLCNQLWIENYNDPFSGKGVMCIFSFEKGNVEDCLKHNRACLLKERDILYARGYYNENDALIR